MQLVRFFAPFLVPAVLIGREQDLAAALLGMMYVPVVAAARLERDVAKNWVVFGSLIVLRQGRPVKCEDDGTFHIDIALLRQGGIATGLRTQARQARLWRQGDAYAARRRVPGESGLDIRDIRKFMELATQGSASYATRKELMEHQRARTVECIEELQKRRSHCSSTSADTTRRRSSAATRTLRVTYPQACRKRHRSSIARRFDRIGYIRRAFVWFYGGYRGD